MSNQRSAAPSLDEPAHAVQFYERDEFLIEKVAHFLGAALSVGDAAVTIATAPHLPAIEARLRALGLNAALARKTGRYLVFDADEALSRIMADGAPDGGRFADVVGSAIRQAAAGDGRRVHAFGEMVAILWADGRREAALQLETLWNELGRALPFSLLCAYPIAAFAEERHGAPFLAICGQHSHVMPAESFASVSSLDARHRAISELQQKASMLENQIAERKIAEAALRETNRTLRESEEERERLLREAEESRRRAEDANRAKDEFLAMLGHELRNPLSAVRNAVVTARLDPSRRDRALEIARRQADQLARLVDDLLDLARITQGRITLRTQRVRFDGIVERAVEVSRQLVEERAHEISISLPRDPVEVDGDPTRLEQVVVNLISNAVKYTEPGGRIEIALERHGDQSILRVRDDGVGIAPEVLPRVFDLFAQSDRSLDRAQGGLGIGLTVVRRLIELHGGWVAIRSDGLGAGTEVEVRMPLARSVGMKALAPSDAAPDRQRYARLLVVEDNADAAESLRMLLELLGHDVSVAYDALSALDLARANPPDLMLVDIGLPGMDGYELARRARVDPILAGIVLVALTGYGRDEDKERAIAAGFNYHLTKPVEVDALHGLVMQVAKAEAGKTKPSLLQ